jgi:CRISPR-associated protein Csb2
VDVSVRFYGDSYLGRRSDKPNRPEWPVAPDRLFQGFTNAAYHLEGPTQRALALRWLEWFAALPPPIILAVPVPEQVTTHIMYSPRSVVSSKGVINPRQDLIDIVETPLADPLIVFQYEGGCPEEFSEIAKTVAAAISYVGASESLAVVTIAREKTSMQHIAYRPDPHGSLQLPVHYSGRLADLDRAFKENARPLREVWEPRARAAGKPVRYAAVESDVRPPAPASGDFEQFLPLAFTRTPGTTGPVIDSVAFPAFTNAARAAFLRRLPAGADGILSGHDHFSPDPGNTAYPGAHAAFVPLADLGFPYASSRLRGIALVLPRGIGGGPQRGAALRAFDLSEIFVGGERYRLSHIRGDEEQLQATRPYNYTHASKTWATFTPLCLWKMPNRSGSNVPELVAQAIQQAGFPDPTCVETSGTPFVVGGRHARSFRNRLEKPYWLVHALFSFDVPVAGPMLIGRARHVGFGLCGPQKSARGHAA